MAWGTVNVDEQRVRFVVSASRREKSMRQLCEEFQISRPTGYEWLRRYQGRRDRGSGGKEPPAAPQSGEDNGEDRAAGDRIAPTAAGLGSTEAAGVLYEREQIALPVITVHRILLRHGLVQDQDQHRTARGAL